MIIQVGARSSKLSKKQTEEVLSEISVFYPGISFELKLIETIGDKDLKTPLSSMGKTNFFTKEVDECLINKGCRIAIHSAKDLPEHLAEGLQIIALTKGKSPVDSLVISEKEHFHTLPKRAKIGSSSAQRQKSVYALRPDLRCVEVRGKIDERLALIKTGKIQGLVVAEAALIRLGYTHLNRIFLTGETAPFQGQLAVVARSSDREMEALFSKIDTRNKKGVLYTGLSFKECIKKAVHCPMIQTNPKDFGDQRTLSAIVDLSLYTHLIFSSKVGVRMFFDSLKYHRVPKEVLNNKKMIAVGLATASELKKRGLKRVEVPKEATQEGIVRMLSLKDISKDYFLLLQSFQARQVLTQFFIRKKIRHQVIFLYETRPKVPEPIPNLKGIGEIIFTSPSTVKSFFDFFKRVPNNTKLTAIGPVTKNALKAIMKVKF